MIGEAELEKESHGRLTEGMVHVFQGLPSKEEPINTIYSTVQYYDKVNPFWLLIPVFLIVAVILVFPTHQYVIENPRLHKPMGRLFTAF